ncbi:hypothetical protein [Synechococcus sp. UW179A]|uniref:hypothetical protein n=1 Tax=Synechococcus sp. UW179A TaxID=2575510 RepID=UPI0010BEC4D1|nr:hypothetical protein [Synechococcus sp. UW179A]
MKRKLTMAPTTVSTSGPRNTGKNRCSLAQGSSGLSSSGSSGYIEGGHQLEKLEFALAVAITRGDRARSDQLRAQIAELGGNIEEPGT